MSYLSLIAQESITIVFEPSINLTISIVLVGIVVDNYIDIERVNKVPQIYSLVDYLIIKIMVFIIDEGTQIVNIEQIDSFKRSMQDYVDNKKDLREKN